MRAAWVNARSGDKGLKFGKYNTDDAMLIFVIDAVQQRDCRFVPCRDI